MKKIARMVFGLRPDHSGLSANSLSTCPMMVI